MGIRSLRSSHWKFPGLSTCTTFARKLLFFWDRALGKCKFLYVALGLVNLEVRVMVLTSSRFVEEKQCFQGNGRETITRTNSSITLIRIFCYRALLI